VRFFKKLAAEDTGKRASADAAPGVSPWLQKQRNLSQQTWPSRYLRASLVINAGGNARSLLIGGRRTAFANHTISIPLGSVPILEPLPYGCPAFGSPPTAGHSQNTTTTFHSRAVRQQPERPLDQAWVYLGGKSPHRQMTRQCPGVLLLCRRGSGQRPLRRCDCAGAFITLPVFAPN